MEWITSEKAAVPLASWVISPFWLTPGTILFSDHFKSHSPLKFQLCYPPQLSAIDLRNQTANTRRCPQHSATRPISKHTSPSLFLLQGQKSPYCLNFSISAPNSLLWLFKALVHQLSLLYFQPFPPYELVPLTRLFQLFFVVVKYT